MMNYKNRTNTSCTYDAFEAAGLPVSEDMLHGISIDQTFSLLKQNGYRVISGEGEVVELPLNEGFFVFRPYKKGFDHVEYHINPEGVTEYPPESILAIAVKAHA